MRIVAGKFGSRPIKSVAGDQTRPTADKIKGAIFSRIGPYFDGGRMLDLFSGSGNMGLEAISRGMDYALLCDYHMAAIQIIKENVKTLQVDTQCKVLKSDYHQTLRQCKDTNECFVLIFLDPPYALVNKADIIKDIDEYNLLVNDGNLIIETAKEEELPLVIGSCKQVKSVIYGITRITYYRKDVEEDA